MSTENVNLQILITGDKNPRGIPAAKFIENVDDFLGHGKFSVESALGALNELYSKYKYMESSFEKSKSIYKSKLPEIEQTLELVKLMVSKSENEEEMITNYGLSDTLYAKAQIDLSANVVYLWIGAGTMVEYTYEEAIDLLQNQQAQTKLKIQELQEDLYFLRGNSITVEVNMARLFNHSVKARKLQEAAEKPAVTNTANP
eukprot:gene1404-1488_t